MRNNWKILVFSSLFSLSLLAACNVNNNDSNEQQDDVLNNPADYENDADLEDEEENKSFIHDEDPDQTDQELQKGDDLEFDSDRGAE